MAERQSIMDAIDQVKTSAGKMFSQIGDLAKAELKPAAKNAGLGAVFVVALAVVAATALFILLLTCGFALSIIYNQVLGRSPITALTFGFLTLFVLCIILVALCAIAAWKRFKKVQGPKATIAETKASLGAITDAIKAGLNSEPELSSKAQVKPDLVPEQQSDPSTAHKLSNFRADKPKGMFD